MTEDVRPDVIKRTQDLLGKYFKKPPLTEKLLKKPPFRFLHDIISAIIKETGFLDGLFSEAELNSENIKNKEDKLAFLTKLIDVVKLITGSNLAVRASKIVAGHEPTRTNELLQAIGKALDKKVSSAEAIEHYKESRQKKVRAAKPASLSKEETAKKPASRQSSQSRKPPEKEKPLSDQKKRSTNAGKVSAREPKTRVEEKRERKHAQEKENKEKDAQLKKSEDVPQIQQAESAEERQRSSGQNRRRSSSGKSTQAVTFPETAESTKLKPALVDSTNSPTHKIKDPSSQSRKDSATNKTRQPSADQRGEVPIQNGTEAQSPLILESKAENTEAKKITSQKSLESEKGFKENERNGVSVKNTKISPIGKPKDTKRISSAQENGSTEHSGSPSDTLERRADTAKAPISDSEATTVRPRTSLRPPSVRPISARPAAPRMRSKTEFILNEDISTPMGNVNVIVENFDSKEDDADHMVVVEAGGGGDSLGINGTGKIESQLTQDHGHLVAQILETQRELVNTDNVDVMPKKVDIVREWEAGSKKDREATIKEIDKLRGAIQTLTRATNPLGKLLDYLQEDVEMMQRELLEWRSQYNLLSKQLEEEQIQTQESVEPMKQTLKDIESNIKDELDKICQLKSSIMRNGNKIERLLNGHP